MVEASSESEVSEAAAADAAATATATATATHWLHSSGGSAESCEVDCLCLGTGRFLRAVLVPALVGAGLRPPVLVQPRGRTFLDLLLANDDEDGSGGGCGSYEVDTILPCGQVETAQVPVSGAFSLGRDNDRQAFIEWLSSPSSTLFNSNGGLPRILGVGVTEAGLSAPDTPAMKDLYMILKCLCLRRSSSAECSTMSVVNTDNVPFNGDVLRSHMIHLAEREQRNGGDGNAMVEFLSKCVWFHNTMVDRITSHRPGNSLIPRAEPIPAKALVILDPEGHFSGLLADDMRTFDSLNGVVLRRASADLETDLELKLRVANGTHTAVAHALALMGLTLTNQVVAETEAVNEKSEEDNVDNTFPGDTGQSCTSSSSLRIVVEYLDSFVDRAVVPAWVARSVAVYSTATTNNNSNCDPNEPEAVAARVAESNVRAVWKDWRGRLWHPTFGLSTYFITQNGPAKGGIRIGPTVRDLLRHASGDTSASEAGPLSQQPQSLVPSPVPVTVAYALAALLRWLTPSETPTATTATGDRAGHGSRPGVYRGWLQQVPLSPMQTKDDGSDDAIEYADGLHYNLKEGWYEFRCVCHVSRRNSILDGGGNESSTRSNSMLLSAWLGGLPRPARPSAYREVVRSYLVSPEGGGLADVSATHPEELDALVGAIAALYARMVAGDDLLEMLAEMKAATGPYVNGGMATSCSALADDDPSTDGNESLHY
jgi:hypothetical protein